MQVPSIKFPCPVRRLSVQWNDNRWEVVDDVPVPSMTLPASATLPKTEGAVVGFWFEARDDAGQVLYRQVLDDPIDDGIELFEADGSIARVSHVVPHSTTIEILVPDLPKLAEVHFVSSRAPHVDDSGKERGPKLTRSVTRLRGDYEQQ